MIKLNNKQLGLALVTNGIIFTVIIFLWPITMMLAPGTNGTMNEQFTEILNNTFFYKLSFVVASFIGPSLLSLMFVYTFFVDTKKSTPILNILGFTFLIPYVVFVTISYTTQYTYFLNLLSLNSEMAGNWYFGNFNSLSYYFNQLGYTFFAFGGILIGYRFCFDNGIKKVFGILLEFCSLLSIVAFVGLALGSKLINVATLISGLLTLPFGYIAIIIAKDVIKRGT